MFRLFISSPSSLGRFAASQKSFDLYLLLYTYLQITFQNFLQFNLDRHMLCLWLFVRRDVHLPFYIFCSTGIRIDGRPDYLRGFLLDLGAFALVASLTLSSACDNQFQDLRSSLNDWQSSVCSRACSSWYTPSSSLNVWSCQEPHASLSTLAELIQTCCYLGISQAGSYLCLAQSSRESKILPRLCHANTCAGRSYIHRFLLSSRVHLCIHLHCSLDRVQSCTLLERSWTCQPQFLRIQ